MPGIAHELATLNESLQALAYAALGRQGPEVRRRRTGQPGNAGTVPSSEILRQLASGVEPNDERF